MTEFATETCRDAWPRNSVDYLAGYVELGLPVDDIPVRISFDQVVMIEAVWDGPSTPAVNEEGLSVFRRKWRTAEPITSTDLLVVGRRSEVTVFCQVTDDPTIPMFVVGHLQLV